MTDFALTQVAIGGGHEYIEIIQPNGALVQFLHQIDDLGIPVKFITGLTYRTSTGDLHTCCTPSLTQAYSPHDIESFPNGSGLLVAVVPRAGVLEFRKYSYDGRVLQTWHPPHEYGWAQQSTKISIACDNKTVFYTQSLRRIMRYDLLASAALADYQTLPLGSPYIFGGIKVIPGTGVGDTLDVVVAMTSSGDGPRQAVCLDSSKVSFWTDEVHPASSFHVFKRRLDDGSQLLSVVTRANPSSLNDKTYSLACYFRACPLLAVLPRPQLIS